VAPKGRQMKANLGRLGSSTKRQMMIEQTLPSSLENWTELNLIETFKLTKRLDLREMIAIELQKRLSN